ncbi:MAG: DUF1127 domain-containing protein [Proteobacteria bacterium]|nr:DUF1127 domain-containing protein [Pseudomonadota bacterium]
MNRSTGFSPLAGDQSPLEVFTDYGIRLFSVLQGWNDRARQRHHLSQLDDRLLADIGVSRAAAAHEAAKQPWE